MSNHTPGPWKFQPYSMEGEELEKIKRLGIEPVRQLRNDGSAPVCTASGYPVALVTCRVNFKRGFGHLTDDGERDANARLIAAAPELLAALERTTNALRLAYSKKPMRDMQETLAEAEAILAKIEGQV